MHITCIHTCRQSVGHMTTMSSCYQIMSSRTEELFNLPSLVLKASHLGGSAFCNFYRLGVSEQAMDGIHLGFGIVVEDKPSELSCDALVFSMRKTSIKHMEEHAPPIHVQVLVFMVVDSQCFIQRVGNLWFPNPKLKFPPSSFADFCHIIYMYLYYFSTPRASCPLSCPLINHDSVWNTVKVHCTLSTCSALHVSSRPTLIWMGLEHSLMSVEIAAKLY